MISTQKRSTAALLASSLLLTIGRGATLPFMTIYLNRQYAMSVDQVGYAMTTALTIGVVFSLGFGILADKFDKKRYMLLAIAVFLLGFSAIPLVSHAGLVVLFFSLINCAYSVFSTVLKAYFSDTLGAAAKARIFSLNYTFINIGWTVGPPIGTMLVMYSINLPFWLAAFCSAIPWCLFSYLFAACAWRRAAKTAWPGRHRCYCVTARYAGLPYPACWPLLSPGRLRLVLRSMSCRSPTATLPRRSLP
jgi:MFS family permease